MVWMRGQHLAALAGQEGARVGEGLAPDDPPAQGLALDEAHDEAVAEAVLRRQHMAHGRDRHAPGAAASIRAASVSRPTAVSETRVPPGARRRISGTSVPSATRSKRQISWVAPADSSRQSERPLAAQPGANQGVQALREIGAVVGQGLLRARA